MKKNLFCLILLAAAGSWSFAQEATTTVQVAPSDQVIYPDAAQILNKTEPVVEKPTPKPSTPVVSTTPVVTTPPVAASPADGAASPSPRLPSSKPLLATTPVPARPATVNKPTTAPAAAPAPAHGWFLKWTVTGPEAGVRSWAEGLGLKTQITPLSPDLWEVVAGPFVGDGLKQALAGQGGKAQLFRR